LNGVIYLHDISCNQFPIADVQQNLDFFKYLCGDLPIGKILLGTTKWERVDERYKRQEEVEKHWKSLVHAGSTIFHFDRDQSSAIAIINVIVSAKNEIDKPSKHLIDVCL